MFFDPIDIPDKLLEAQELGKLVVFAGAGVSMGNPSNLPSFKGLAAQIAGSHPFAQKIDQYDTRLDRFLGELLRQKVEVETVCRSIIGNPESKPTELHNSLAGLFIRPEDVRIVTTNFDNHFPIKFDERGWKIDCYYAPALPLGNRFSGVVFLHGWIKRPEPLVLADEEFGRAYLTEGWAREFLQRLFAEFTTLFVGYSHDDIPVEYLARGMSGKSLAPRFALTAAGETGQWASLGIREIYFKKTRSPNPYENLYTGIKKWAEFSQQQPTDIAERVKDIVCSPENIIPDKSQSSLLRRCLEREDSCHFFTREATGWHWVEWVQGQGLLHNLFTSTTRDLTGPQRQLANWLANELLAENSDEGLLLLQKHNCYLRQELWFFLCRGLWTDDQLDWSDPLVEKWVLLLTETCQSNSKSDLARLLNKVAKKNIYPLGLTILRRLVQFRVVVRKSFDFHSLMQNGDTVEAKDKADFEILISGDVHELVMIWRECFKPHLSELREPLLMFLENGLREGHELYRTMGVSDATRNPCCHRSRIYERDGYPTGDGLDFVLDLFLGVLEASINQGWSLPESRIENWLGSENPVLIRVGLYGLHLSRVIPESRKVELLRERQLVHPAVFGATHEAWLVLSECYASLDLPAKQALWLAITEGPIEKRRKDVTSESWQKWRQNQIDKLICFIGEKNEDCPEAQKELSALRQRKSDFRGYKGMDQVSFGRGTVTEGIRTPKSATELLSSPPVSQIEWLLKYEGGKAPFEESREGLLDAVGAACAENNDWGIALLEELGNRNAWDSDLWEKAFWRINLSVLPQVKLAWLLRALESHFAESPSIQGLTFFLFHGVDFSDEKRPSAENLDLMIRLSLLIWKQIKDEEPPVNKDFKTEEWANRALNHPGGRITEFWLKYCDLRRRESDNENSAFPEWIFEPLNDMVEGMNFASQLGRVTLAQHFAFVYHVDSAWTAAHLFPKFKFSIVGDEAYLMWEPHAGYGDLSRELILRMPPIYRDAFPRIHDFKSQLQAGFFRHIAGMVYSCLFDVNKDNWLNDFLTSLTEDEKANWAKQVEWGLRGAPEPRKEQIWNQWMKEYWEDRLKGRPCSIQSHEASEMVDWAFAVGKAFPEAVEFVLRGPRVQQKLGIILHILEKHDSPEKYPMELLELLNWLLEDTTSHPMDLRSIESVMMRMPKKSAYLPMLNSICQRMESLGCPGVSEFMQRIKQEFTEN